jgi:hypothetical protein
MSEGDVDLKTPLSLRSSLRFPVQHALARREVLIGALLLVLLPGVGWVLNMGHRIMMVHRMMHGQAPWPSWRGWPTLLRHGTVTLLGMVYYYSPTGLLLGLGRWAWPEAAWALWAGAGVCFALATVAIPGFMSHYCRAFDPREIFDPWRALSRVKQGGAAYWRAWGIVLCALALSFVGLLGLGVGFFFTSVWFWQTAGFSFATVFTRRFALDERAEPLGEPIGRAP